jgi:hypothetical protein
MIETIRMIANIIGHLRLCYQLLKFWVVGQFDAVAASLSRQMAA